MESSNVTSEYGPPIRPWETMQRLPQGGPDTYKFDLLGNVRARGIVFGSCARCLKVCPRPYMGVVDERREYQAMFCSAECHAAEVVAHALKYADHENPIGAPEYTWIRHVELMRPRYILIIS